MCLKAMCCLSFPSERTFLCFLMLSILHILNLFSSAPVFAHKARLNRHCPYKLLTGPSSSSPVKEWSIAWPSF
ncbi:hypothetical protein DUNSADRAFT_12030 [Dunaliella salina]|uniref:Secreted protein n=1 Tax=Dunaliella salina TaxID=3046 RepID=A0ABQ7GC35_DUNSA|nr:hypothetical protein DUNSADRAFT_12030 [Dunaliella salina]|eukprot:KAF5832161.1 hypothetical protein DUNSADRAFT_12030 [Dunaliella salina]